MRTHTRTSTRARTHGAPLPTSRAASASACAAFTARSCATIDRSATSRAFNSRDASATAAAPPPASTPLLSARARPPRAPAERPAGVVATAASATRGSSVTAEGSDVSAEPTGLPRGVDPGLDVASEDIAATDTRQCNACRVSAAISTGSILSPGQGWHRRANAQKCYRSAKGPPNGTYRLWRAAIIFASLTSLGTIYIYIPCQSPKSGNALVTDCSGGYAHGHERRAPDAHLPPIPSPRL